MKKNIKSKTQIIVYQAKNGAIELRGDISHETIWATQAQIARLFNVTPQNVTLHLDNIYKEKEVSFEATCKESLQVQKEGNRQVKRNLKYYNLDAIIAVGYRINSVIGTNFRIWATKTLRQYIIDGFVINKKHNFLIAKIARLQRLQRFSHWIPAVVYTRLAGAGMTIFN